MRTLVERAIWLLVGTALAVLFVVLLENWAGLRLFFKPRQTLVLITGKGER